LSLDNTDMTTALPRPASRCCRISVQASHQARNGEDQAKYKKTVAAGLGYLMKMCRKTAKTRASSRARRH